MSALSSLLLTCVVSQSLYRRLVDAKGPGRPRAAWLPPGISSRSSSRGGYLSSSSSSPAILPPDNSLPSGPASDSSRRAASPTALTVMADTRHPPQRARSDVSFSPACVPKQHDASSTPPPRSAPAVVASMLAGLPEPRPATTNSKGNVPRFSLKNERMKLGGRTVTCSVDEQLRPWRLQFTVYDMKTCMEYVLPVTFKQLQTRIPSAHHVPEARLALVEQLLSRLSIHEDPSKGAPTLSLNLRDLFVSEPSSARSSAAEHLPLPAPAPLSPADEVCWMC